VNVPQPREPFGSPPAAAGAAAPAAPAQAPADPTLVPVAGLAVEIAARAQAGRNRFEIRLDPPELGRIDVRLDVDSSGNVTSRLVVERAETLEVLRRDAPELQRALQDAGLKTSDNGLQFTLRDQNFAGRQDRDAPMPAARLIVPAADSGVATETAPVSSRDRNRSAASTSGCKEGPWPRSAASFRRPRHRSRQRQ
jgi:flagellar hook-length control protein FliK